MAYTIIDGNVYQTDDRMTQHIGPASKTETIRIDGNTVADVQYAFDLDAGIYIELSRTERTDVYVPPETPEQQLAALRAKNAQLEQQLAQTNTDMAAFMDFVFGTLDI